MFRTLPTQKRPRRYWTRLAVILAVGLLPVMPQAEAQELAEGFTGAWTGAQSWKTDSPSPYAREGQTVSLLIGTLGGKISGSMTPFLGFAEGATFTDARIVGNQLRATGVIGTPHTPSNPEEWKEAVQIAFVFTIDKGELAGTANLTMHDVPWLKLEYRLRRS